ncbi:hypothetical protein NGM10_15635 (plasmid) [Halorussus salilacus]|uniref:hypothetical protein n=1 Tax=Halorussus salilacus TaxID=2953750 RepID=UPI00209E60F2|nr:hypothetical protein [Halorussus salilacus]USZ69836.1 hypothetical protein NGM10_15635 [Halorussus salilacus]
MAETAYIASALATGVLLVGVFLLVSRAEDWRGVDLPSDGPRGRTAQLADSPAAWTAGFLALAFAVGGGAVVLVSDASLAAGIGDSWVALVAAFAVMLGAYLLWGTYNSARVRGLHSAQAVLVSAWLFGLLFVAAVALDLVTAG